jgi:hypothetical protein
VQLRSLLFALTFPLPLTLALLFPLPVLFTSPSFLPIFGALLLFYS